MEPSSFARALREDLAAGGDPNEADESGMSALHGAALNCDVEAMEVLAEGGADLDLKDKRGNAPLHYAVDYDIDGAHQTRRDVTCEGTRMLLRLGASIHIKDDEGKTPRDVAAAYGADALRLFDAAVSDAQ